MRPLALSLASLLAVGCASVVDKTFWTPPVPGYQATTPGLLRYLVEQEGAYRAARAEAESRHGAFALPLPTGGFLAGTNRRGAKDVAALDRAWRSLLLDMLGNAPTVADFEMRADVLTLTPAERARYLQLFQVGR